MEWHREKKYWTHEKRKVQKGIENQDQAMHATSMYVLRKYSRTQRW